MQPINFGFYGQPYSIHLDLLWARDTYNLDLLKRLGQFAFTNFCVPVVFRAQLILFYSTEQNIFVAFLDFLYFCRFFFALDAWV